MATKVMIRGSYPEELKDDIEAVWGMFETAPATYPMVFDVIDSDRNDYQTVLRPGLSLPTSREENEESAGDASEESYKITFRNFFQAKQIAMSRELIDDSAHWGVATSLIDDLRMVMEQGREKAAAQVFDNANVATMPSRYGGDKQPLLSTTHKTRAGDQANTGSSYMSLSNASLQIILNMMQSNKNERGIPAPLMATDLIVPVNLRLRAKEITGSTLKDSTTDNTKNVLPGEGLNEMSIVVLHHMENKNGWFVKSKLPANQGLVFLDRMPVELNDDTNVSQWNSIWVAGSRFSLGPVDWRAVWGSIT